MDAVVNTKNNLLGGKLSKSFFETRYPGVQEFLSENFDGPMIRYWGAESKLRARMRDVVQKNSAMKFWHSTEIHQRIFYLLCDRFFEANEDGGNPYKSLHFSAILDHSRSSKRAVRNILSAAVKENFLHSHHTDNSLNPLIVRMKARWGEIGKREHMYVFSAATIEGLAFKNRHMFACVHEIGLPRFIEELIDVKKHQSMEFSDKGILLSDILEEEM